MNQHLLVSQYLNLNKPEAFEYYGNLFTDYELETVRLERWPRHSNGWREVDDGLSGGVTSGQFSMEWRDDSLYSVNSAVDGDYNFAKKNSSGIITVLNEINYHSCGSQMFMSPDSDCLLLLAKISSHSSRFPDDVEPNDFHCFYLPQGVGAHIDSYVWHSPPILVPWVKQGTVLTRQAKVHSKIYYRPGKEIDTTLAVKIGE